MVQNHNKVHWSLIFSLCWLCCNSWCYWSSFGEDSAINQVDWSPQDHLIVSASDSNKAILYNAKTLNPICIKDMGKDVLTAKISRDGTAFAVGLQSDDYVTIYSTTFPCLQIASFDTNHGTVKEVDFHPTDNTKLLTCGTDEDVAQWTIPAGTQDYRFSIGEPSQSCKYSDTGLIGASDDDKDIYLYNGTTQLEKFDSNQIGYELDFRPGSHTEMVVASQDERVQIYNGITDTSSTISISPQKKLYSIDYAKDSSFMVAGGQQGYIYFFNTTNLVNTFDQYIRHSSSRINTVRISSATDYLLAGREDGQIHVYKKLCGGCAVGYYQKYLECEKCSIPLQNCEFCRKSTQCLGCISGYYLDSATKQCLTCNADNGCLMCSSSTVCQLCNQQYYLTGGACTRCSVALSNCEQCSSSTVCLKCEPNFILNGNVCQSCGANCAFCSSTSNCLQCVPHYYYNSGSAQCQTCSANCELCDASGCIQCEYGYYLNTNVCVSCPSNCINCQSSSVCLNCIKGYQIVGGACVQCGQGCISCSGGVCQLCYPHYALNTNTCEKCHQHIDGCNHCSSTSVCENCLDGYYLNGGACTLCKISMQGCYLCSSSTACQNCLNGYYLNGGSCSLCSDRQGCQVCNASDCLECGWGYYLDTGVCQQCAASCGSCDNSTCHQCLAGYYLNSNQCELCSSLWEGCIFCNSTDCTQCEGGYYEMGGQCSKCGLEGCEVCSSSSLCLSCNSHYYLKVNNECQLCQVMFSGCSECSSSQCVLCQSGYYEDGGNCVLCENRFPSCDICSPFQCYACESNYYLDSTSCSKCSDIIDGCSLCLTSAQCSICQQGYYLDGSICRNCTTISGCQLCQDSSTCIYCKEQYYLDSGSCLRCTDAIVGCVECSSASLCSLCDGNYQVVGGVCSELKGQQPAQYSQIKIESEEVDANHLKHTVFAVGGKYTQIDQNWQTDVSILLINRSTKEEIDLSIEQVRWQSQNALTFITNNPISESVNPIPVTRRLTAIDINYEIELVMKQAVINQIYPSFDISTDLMVEYALSQPAFYRSLIDERPMYYFIIGISILALLLLEYILKLFCTVPHTPDKGNIIPHIMAFKCGSLAIYPAFPEYINYCYGYALVDLPWLNDYFASKLSDLSQYTPDPYLMHYSTMNLSSIYLLPFAVYGLLALVLLSLRKSCESRRFESLLYNWWIFGLTFTGASCLQGAMYNPLSSISVNGLFYVIGIGAYGIIVCHGVYLFCADRKQINGIRVIIKATLLSFMHVGPLYIFGILVVVEIGLVLYSYTVMKKQIPTPRLWVVSHLLLMVGLGVIIFAPAILLGIILGTVCVGFGIMVDGYNHYSQYHEKKQILNLRQTNVTVENMNVFELDHQFSEFQGEKKRQNEG